MKKFTRASNIYANIYIIALVNCYFNRYLYLQIKEREWKQKQMKINEFYLFKYIK